MRLNADAAVEERRTPCVPLNKLRTTRHRQRDGQAERCGVWGGLAGASPEPPQRDLVPRSGDSRSYFTKVRGQPYSLHPVPRLPAQPALSRLDLLVPNAHPETPRGLPSD